MKKIEFKQIKKPTGRVRSNRDLLIENIAEATNEKDKKKLKAVLAVRSRQLKWTETDLHALLQKRNDPHIRNFTAFVWWSCKLK